MFNRQFVLKKKMVFLGWNYNDYSLVICYQLIRHFFLTTFYDIGIMYHLLPDCSVLHDCSCVLPVVLQIMSTID